MLTQYYRDLGSFRLSLARFSLTDLAKYFKLTIGMYIGFVIPYLIGYPGMAIPMACSTMLTLAVGSSNFAARSYFYQRVVTNALLMPIGSLVIWLTAPRLWLGVLLLPLVVFSIVRAKPHWFRLTSLTVPLALVLYSGEHLPVMEHRVFGVVFGMFLGFIIQQVLLPPDHGYLANKLLSEGNKLALESLERFALRKMRRDEVGPLVVRLQKIRGDLEGARRSFELDLEHSWVMPHLKRNLGRLPLFACYAKIFESLVALWQSLDSLNEEYHQLGDEWREEFCSRVHKICQFHEELSKIADARVAVGRGTSELLQKTDLPTLLGGMSTHSVYANIFLGNLLEYGLLLCKASQLHAQVGSGMRANLPVPKT